MNDLKTIEAEAVSLKERSEKMIVQDQRSYDIAASFVKGSRELKAAIKRFFEPTIESFKQAKAEAEKGRKAEVDRMNRFLEPVESAEQTVKQKCKDYEDAQFKKAEDARKAEEEKERIKAEEEQDRLLAEAAALEKQGDGKAAEAVFEKAESVKQEYVPRATPEIAKTTGLGIVRRWKWKITNESLIPRKYWVLNEVLINRTVVSEKEKTNIPGIEAFRE